MATTLAKIGKTGSMSFERLELTVEFVGGSPVQNRWAGMSEMPAQSPASLAMSKALKKMGFRFVGPTTCYAFMQAAGLVNDHLVSCPEYLKCNALS